MFILLFLKLGIAIWRGHNIALYTALDTYKKITRSDDRR